MKVGATCVSEFATRRSATRRRAALCVVWHWIHQRRRLSADKAHVRVKRRTDRRCDCVKAGPNKHAQNKSRRPGWRRRQLSCPAAVHQQGCWHSRDNAETSPTVQVEMRRSSRDVSDSIQRQSGGFQLNNREQMPQGSVPKREAKANLRPESSEEDREATVTVCTGNDAIQDYAHDAWKDLRGAWYSQWGCCQDCQRSSQSLEHRVSPVWDFEISSLPPRSRRRWGLQAEADRRKREESLQKWRRPAERSQFGATKINKIGTVLNKQLSVQDPGAHAQPKQKLTRHQSSLRCHEQGIVQQSKGQIGWDQQACLRRYQQASRWEQVRFDIPEGAAQRWSEGLQQIGG